MPHTFRFLVLLLFYFLFFFCIRVFGDIFWFGVFVSVVMQRLALMPLLMSLTDLAFQLTAQSFAPELAV